MAIVGANNHSPLQAVAINLPKSASILPPPHRCTPSGVQEPVESECTKCHHRTPSGVRGKIPPLSIPLPTSGGNGISKS
ncbi:MAG: hypothetical protein J6X65_03985 [Bacteroidales bacterium]|nr:hypothetical protein [Bacteroidales bacterium]